MSRPVRPSWIALAPVALLLTAGCALLRPPPPPRSEAELDQERRAAYLARHPQTAPEVAQAIREGKAREGMTRAQVEASLGRPMEQRVLSERNADLAWTYRKRWMAKHTSFDRGVMSEREVPAGEVRTIVRFKEDAAVEVDVRARDYASGREYTPER